MTLVCTIAAMLAVLVTAGNVNCGPMANETSAIASELGETEEIDGEPWRLGWPPDP
jgi:hypothetical protein